MAASAEWVLLLRRYEIELCGAFLVKHRAFGLIAAAPVLVPAGHSEKISRSHPFFARVVFIQISALDDDDRDIVGVCVHASVKSRVHFDKRAVGTLVRVTPNHLPRSPFCWHGLEGRFTRRRINDLFCGYSLG